MFGCGGKARGAVVDPGAAVDEYIQIADERGLRIEAIFLTHVQAGHHSGDRELVARTGALIYAHRTAELHYPYLAIEDNAEISLGNVIVRAVHTPGHSPENTAYLVSDRTRDTLFVGDVGRPDLGGENAAYDLFDSLHGRLLTLPDYVEIFPAHFSGSPCGRSMSGKPSSTIGFERRNNPALQERDRARFATALFEDLPPKPLGFFEMIASNRGA